MRFSRKKPGENSVFRSGKFIFFYIPGVLRSLLLHLLGRNAHHFPVFRAELRHRGKAAVRRDFLDEIFVRFEHIVRRVDALLQNKIVDCHFEFFDKHFPKVVVAVSRHLRQLSDVDILPVIRGNVAHDIVEIMIDGDFLADFAAIDEFDGNDRAEQIDQLIGKGRPVLGFVINLFEILHPLGMSHHKLIWYLHPL